MFDILEEVGRQVNSLKRQAAKAKRYGELKTELVRSCASRLSGRFRMLERELAKIALDLNVATSEFQKLNGGDSRKRKAARSTAGTHVCDRSQADGSAQTTGRVQCGSRACTRPPGIAGAADLVHRRSAQPRRERTQDLEKRFEQQQLELAQHTERLQEVERVAEQSQAVRWRSKSEERDRPQGQLRERERGMETARQQVLKLLGEASTLKNQLAQIDQYLVGIDRDIERIQRDEAVREQRPRAPRSAESRAVAEAIRRQMELQTTVEQRRTIEEELIDAKSSGGGGSPQAGRAPG